ncbi:thioredoxin family protein [Falsibacillus albus]|uniref:Thioredoxin family protein n=1 Tax=Falsibacillus albus TaxID=2478915 RepID=A0A3L7K1A4_9BACI|nr:thioredoxin family protein [Falsibacillus albus]RLQ96848.1 thioredoxin family protein [Falsibacillus albus]
MSLNEWFTKGMTPKEYINSMEKHQGNLLLILESFSIPPEDEHFFEELKKADLRVIVLTEDWCGDAMLNVPILFKIAEAAGMEVRLLERDQNLELMDQYLTNGKSRAIPIFIFIDQEGNERAVWGPRAPKIQQFVDEARAKLPSKEDPSFEENRQKFISTLTKKYRDDHGVWHEVYESIKKVFKK